MTLTPSRPRLLRRSTWTEAQFVTAALRTETVGGALLLVAALVAIAWANSPWHEGYSALRDLTVGPHALHLDLSLGTWAADGLLAIFFFVAGLELKREFIVGDLRSPSKAALPVAAALCGVAVPAILYAVTVASLGGGSAALRGWAIPTATDIAFALAVLAVIGTHLPSSLRSFLLTLAVVDDLVAITIIAVFYTSEVHFGMLALAALPLAGFAALVQRRVAYWWMLVPLAVVTWALVHASGVHATVAGVLLGLVVPVKARASVPRVSSLAADVDVAHRFEHRMRPLSAGVAVPVFAFFAAGVRVVGGGFSDTLADEAAIAVVVALVAGKLLGVFGGTWLFARFTRAELDDDLAWADIAGVSLLAGIGFTVSLLVGELAFGPGSARDEHVKVAVLVASLIAAALAAVVLRRRNTVYRRIEQTETLDADGDGIPDCFAADQPQASAK
ncbi:sodium/proton antiporter, NhaA family [Pedococcus dokdonensis]|uniref:Na(+)/H(+) antiporter NhaA n=1 Tax=Pedococcus dokdonensis TaxID=443156 RepID=A0A1H0UJW9_9MICO|nr:Na+/H+ antiporter NhaA [Pedococcus dokdonensis]SDP66471.1 sodium/proton antiporter, NhaA family [Pedococcus dokdonensis]